ncbi:serine hydrolase [Arthrobacter sp. 49Tsu3.1M3]|uniref:serine hydrolase n=1 Tax=Arthrobacter sp. 49Tsu3.1M3 TaxID=1279029 RepID=UPI002118AD5C|nr:serine hydrolase [Arthrobacter sp. 49Tsu3.1M3]
MMPANDSNNSTGPLRKPEPAPRHYRSGGHRANDGSKPGPRSLARREGRIRRQNLTAAAVALALVAAGVYAGVQAALPVDPPAAAATPTEPAADAGRSVPPASDLPATASPGTASPAAGAVSAAAGKPAEVAAVPAVAVPAIDPELDSQINEIIAANSAYALGVSLIDVSDGVVHGYGAQDKFVAASTAKILAASAYYHLVETGRASLTAPMGNSTAGTQIRRMVQQSNNDSWALILRAVGQRGITDYAASIGITYDRTVNLLTPAEMARTLQLLYTGQLLNARNSAQLLSYMQNTNFETLIPPAVPPGVGVHHKYGLLFGNLHDAAVLDKDGRAFVFVVYTRGRNYSDMGPRTQIIQQLTRTVTAALF